MGEIGEDWAFWNERSKKHQTDKQEWGKELLSQWCQKNGIVMKEMQPWHVRLTNNDLVFDIYPQRQKWHNVSKNKRGQYRDMIECLNIEFKIK